MYIDARSLSVCRSTRRGMRIIGSSHRRSSDDRLARAASIRGSHGARRADRQRARMVRLRGLRLLREQHRRAILPAIQPHRPTDAGLCGVRARVRGAPPRQPGARHGRRPYRPAGAADDVHRTDGRRHAHDRTDPGLRADRCCRTLAARHDADRSGLLSRRRVHGVDGLHDRAGLSDDARSGQQLHRGGHHDRIHSWIRVRLARQCLDEYPTR